MNIEGKKILVTGGTGFLGKNLVPELSEHAESVIVVSAEESDIFSEFENVKIVTGDLTDSVFCKKVLNDIDVCFHLASFKKNFKYHLEHPLEVFSKNVLISEVFFEAVNRSKIKSLVIASSVAIYESSDDLLAESDPLNLETKDAYALSKIVTEANARILSMENSELSVSIARCDNFFGEHDNFGPEAQVIPSLIRKSVNDSKIEVWGSGNQERTFVYVEDVCSALIGLADLGNGFHVFNVSSGESASFKKIIGIIQKIIGIDKEVVFDTTKPEGAKRRLVSANKIMKDLEWRPEFDLVNGLRKTVEYYLELENKCHQ